MAAALKNALMRRGVAMHAVISRWLERMYPKAYLCNPGSDTLSVGACRRWRPR